MIIIVGLLHELNKVCDLSLAFSTARVTDNVSAVTTSPIGLKFGATVDVHKYIGIDADVGIQSKTLVGSTEAFNWAEYLFGPRFSAGSQRATVFGHVLVGGVHHWRDTEGARPTADKAPVSRWRMGAASIST
jgi:hypothetical protein